MRLSCNTVLFSTLELELAGGAQSEARDETTGNPLRGHVDVDE